jgi:hypothetical protein
MSVEFEYTLDVNGRELAVTVEADGHVYGHNYGADADGNRGEWRVECEDVVLKITDARGKHYGHPRDHFRTTRHLYTAWLGRRREVTQAVDDTENALYHAVYMICDKLARAANDPTHADNWDDVAGYARCAKMVLGLDKEPTQ